MGHSVSTAAVSPHARRLTEGRLHPGEEPGLCLSVAEGLAREHPNQRAYLSGNRVRCDTLGDEGADMTTGDVPNDLLRPSRRPTENGMLHLGLGNFHRAHQAVYTAAALEVEDGP